ncbi:hypothetical protein [Amycolatopsis sp. lyj-346]|uniref:hypothetical protein n=1 Tax=Amycolatopsis sp. lyj-346 TaxID=2789289 RepID=UPI00397A3A8D
MRRKIDASAGSAWSPPGPFVAASATGAEADDLFARHPQVAPNRPNVALVAFNAPKATLGAFNAPKATLGALDAPKAALGALSAPKATLGRWRPGNSAPEPEREQGWDRAGGGPAPNAQPGEPVIESPRAMMRVGVAADAVVGTIRTAISAVSTSAQ